MNKLDFNPKTLELTLIGKDGFCVSLNQDFNLSKKIQEKNKIDRYRIEVSLVCDLACEYCVVHMNRVSQKEKIMSLDTAKKIIEEYNLEVGDSGSLMLIGGEPLLNWEAVKYFVTKCKGGIMIFTNAYKLNDEKMDFLKKHKVLILASLDGSNLKHNKSRFSPDVERRFKIVLSNIKKAIQKGCRVGIGCVVHKENARDVLKIAKFFTDDLRAKSLSFSYPHFTVERTKTNNFSMKKYTEGMISLFSFSKKNQIYINQVGKLLRVLFQKEVIASACKAGLSQRAFYPNGEETVCTKLDTIPGYKIANFFKVLPVNNKKCLQCVALNFCGGGCPWDAAVSSNEKGVDKRICGHNKTLVGYIINDIEKELKRVKSKKEALKILKEKYYPIMQPVWKS